MTNSRNNSILCTSFNQDSSCFAVGTTEGFLICDANTYAERFRRDFENGGIMIIQMLYKCNILAFVGTAKNDKFPNVNKVMIWDDSQAQCIAELEFRSQVRSVRLRRDRVLVSLDNKIFMYNFADLRLLDQIDTAPNPSGLCAVCNTMDSLIIAVLGEKDGQVRINNYSIKQFRVIEAHSSPISQLALSFDGSKVATTSSRGTIIRVFETHTGKLLQEFRRGSVPATIQYIAFNEAATALCVSSDKGTIHIYYCSPDYNNRKSTFSWMSPVVPQLGSSWSALHFSVEETQSICAFGEYEDGKGTIIVIGLSGRYYKYSFTPEGCKEEKTGEYLRIGT
jgi:WD40 repeat protein